MKCDIDENLDDYICPITQQIFLEPVVASDGNTYEKIAILEWYKINKNSPITREILEEKFYPNYFVVSKIKNLEEKYPFLYTNKYQLSLKNWLLFFNKKYNIVLNFPFNKLLDDLNIKLFEIESSDTYIHPECKNNKYCKYGGTCNLSIVFNKLTNINTLVDNIDKINMCIFSHRKILYDELLFNTPSKKYINKLITLSSPDDHGFKYFLNKAMIDDYHYFNPLDIFNILNPKIYFADMSLKMFQKYITRIDTFDKLYSVIKEQYQYFNNSFHQFTLHYVLRNYNLLTLAKTNLEYIENFNTLILFIVDKFSIPVDLKEPCFGSIVNCFIGALHWFWGSDALYIDINHLNNCTISNTDLVHHILCTLGKKGFKWQGFKEEIYWIMSLKVDKNDYKKILLPIHDMIDYKNNCMDVKTFNIVINYLSCQNER